MRTVLEEVVSIHSAELGLESKLRIAGWLKRATPQNIVIGGAAGAAPPVLGWAAVQNDVTGHALLLLLDHYLPALWPG